MCDGGALSRQPLSDAVSRVCTLCPWLSRPPLLPRCHIDLNHTRWLVASTHAQPIQDEGLTRQPNWLQELAKFFWGYTIALGAIILLWVAKEAVDFVQVTAANRRAIKDGYEVRTRGYEVRTRDGCEAYRAMVPPLLMVSPC